MRLIIFFLSLSVLLLTIWIIWGGNWEKWSNLQLVASELQNARTGTAIAGIMLLSADVILPIPGTVVMSAMGYLHGIFIGTLISLTGSMTAGIIGYGMGCLCGEKWALKLLGEKDYHQGKIIFQKSGGWMIAMSRAVPILPEALTVSAGLLRMPLTKFIPSLICGALPMSIVFAWIGTRGRTDHTFAFLSSLIIPAILWGAFALWKWKSKSPNS